MPHSLRHHLTQATADLAAALALEPREARIEAQALLGYVLNQPRAWLIAHDTDLLADSQAEAFRHVLERRLNGEPVAYILGVREFYGLEFAVSPAVLIPRPETELLVELALQRLPENTACRVLDLGTGSGALAVALAKLRPHARVTAVDASAAALEVAQANGQRNGVGNVRFLLSDWFSALAHETFDLIVSNPPYIESGDPHLSRGDVRFEPPSALASGADGLDDIRRIATQAPSHLVPNGWILFEHGYNQAERCRAVLRQAGFADVTSARDLADIERVTLGRKA